MLMLPRFLVVLLLLPVSAYPGSRSLGSMCLANEAVTFDHAKNASMHKLTRTILTRNQFSLFSFVYSMMPPAGYPVTFDEDGSVHAMQFNGARWTLDNGEVHLWNSNNEVFRTFRYNARCNSLTSTVKMGGQPILMEIAIVRPAN